MELPDRPLVYDNKELYNYIKGHTKKDNILYNLKVLGKGAAGTTFTANVKKHEEKVVLKELSRTRFARNEQKALEYLREKMLEGVLPGYYIYMFDYYISGPNKYIIMEKADKMIDTYLEENDLTSNQYYHLFWSVADAVDCLEELKFNHGDLWSENIMISFIDTDSNDSTNESEKKYNVKFIDYDCAYNKEGNVVNPSYGGSNKFRKKFLIGYDLSRFFDGFLFSYNDMLKKINKETKRIKCDKKKAIIKEEYLDENIRFPQEIIDFMISLEPKDPNVFIDNPNTSGKTIKEKIEIELSRIQAETTSDTF